MIQVNKSLQGIFTGKNLKFNIISFVYLIFILGIIGILVSSQVIGLQSIQEDIANQTSDIRVMNRFSGEDSGVGNMNKLVDGLEDMKINYDFNIFIGIDFAFMDNMDIFYSNFTKFLIPMANETLSLHAWNSSEINLLSNEMIQIEPDHYGVMLVPDTFLDQKREFSIQSSILGESYINHTLRVIPYDGQRILLFTDALTQFIDQIKSSLSLFDLVVDIKINDELLDNFKLLNDREEEVYNDLRNILSSSFFRPDLLVIERSLRQDLDKVASGQVLGGVVDLFQNFAGFLFVILIASLVLHVYYLNSKSEVRDILMRRGASSSYIFKYFFKPTMNTFIVNFTLLQIILLGLMQYKLFTGDFIRTLVILANTVLVTLFGIIAGLDFLYLRLYSTYSNSHLSNQQLNPIGFIRNFFLFIFVFGLVGLSIFRIFSNTIKSDLFLLLTGLDGNNPLIKTTLISLAIWLILKKEDILILTATKMKKSDFDIFSLQFKRHKIIGLVFPILLILALSVHTTSYTFHDRSVQNFQENEFLHTFGDAEVFTDDLGHNVSNYLEWIQQQDIVTDYGLVATLTTYEDAFGSESSEDLHVFANTKYFIEHGNISDKFFKNSVNNFAKLDNEPGISIAAAGSQDTSNDRNYLGYANDNISISTIHTTIADEIKFNLPGLDLTETSLLVGNSTIPLNAIGAHKGRLFISFDQNSTRSDILAFFDRSMDRFEVGVSMTDLNDGDVEYGDTLQFSSTLLITMSLIISCLMITIYGMILLNELEKVTKQNTDLWLKGISKSGIRKGRIMIGVLNGIVDFFVVSIFVFVLIVSTMDVHKFSQVSPFQTFMDLVKILILPIFLGIGLVHASLIEKSIRRI